MEDSLSSKLDTSSGITNSLRIPHSPPLKEDAPGVGASGIRSRSGGMSFTVNSSISTRRFHASNEDSEEEEPEDGPTSPHATSSLSSRPSSSSHAGSSSSRERDVAESSKQSAKALREKTELTKEQLWAHVFHNVNRAVDELYYLCEAEDCQEHTEEAVKLMMKNSRDFEKLIERFQAQKEYEASKNSADTATPVGVAWEVRKTVNSTPPLCAGFDIEGGSSIRSTSMGDHVIRHALETMEEKARLERAEGNGKSSIASQPAVETPTPTSLPEPPIKPPSPAPSGSLSALMGNSRSRAVPSPVNVEIKGTIAEPPLSARERRNRRRAESHVSNAHSPVRPVVSLNPPSLQANTTTLMSNNSQSSSVSSSPRVPVLSHKKLSNNNTGSSHQLIQKESNDEEENVSEEILETEKVWAVAEAWVEAEAAAEELAWERLQRGDVSLSMLEADEKAREEKSLARGSPAEWLLSGGDSDGSSDEEDAVKKEKKCEQIRTQKASTPTASVEEAKHELDIDGDDDEDEEEEVMDFGVEEDEKEEEEEEVMDFGVEEDEKEEEEEVMDFGVEEDEKEEEVMDFGVEDESEFIKDKEEKEEEKSKSPDCGRTSPITTSKSSSKNTAGNSRPSVRRSGSGNMEVVDPVLNARGMHSKLSSPTRRKQSAIVTKKKAEMRHDQAQQNRVILETNQRIKFEEAAQKAKLAKVRVENRQSAAEESHFAKLSEGGRRHAEHIDAIRSKAENENIKVEEVLFINGLTAAGIKRSLDDRLREVEARMEQGRIRKAEEIEAKKEQQRRRENMVSLRLRNNEQLAGERWFKLQALIEDVGRRRKNRLDEIARRRERASSASVNSNTNSSSGGGVDTGSAVAPFATSSSDSLPTTPLPVPQDATGRPLLKKSFSLPHSPQASKDEDDISASMAVALESTSTSASSSSSATATTNMEHHELPSHVRKSVSLEEKSTPAYSLSKASKRSGGLSSQIASVEEQRQPPLKTNSRSHHLLSKSKSPSKSNRSSQQSPVPLALPGSLAAASFWESSSAKSQVNHSNQSGSVSSGSIRRETGTSAATSTAAEEHPSVVGRELRRKDSEREAATRSAGLDDGASVFYPSAEPIVDPTNKKQQSPTIPSSTSNSHTSMNPTTTIPSSNQKSAFKRKGSAGSFNDSKQGSFNEKNGRGGGAGGNGAGGGRGRKAKHAQSFDEKSNKQDQDDDGEGGVANRGKKLRKLRTKLLRLAPGWNESRWGCVEGGSMACSPSSSSHQTDSWSMPVVGSKDTISQSSNGSSSNGFEMGLNATTRSRLDRCVDSLRRFRDHSANSSAAGKGGGSKNKPTSPAIKPCTPQASVSELETSLHDLGRLLSDLSMGVGATSSAQSSAVQRRIRESGGLELLQQLTAPRHSAFNSTASPLALDALSLCFAGEPTQCDFVLAMDAGVGVVDAATYALEMVISTERGLSTPHAPSSSSTCTTSSSQHHSDSSSPSAAFGTTPGSHRSLASLSAMVERASQPSTTSSKQQGGGKKAESSSIASVGPNSNNGGSSGSLSMSFNPYSQAGNPWETLNTTILLLMHLLRHSASAGLEVAQESMVRFLCVTGFLQDLVSLLTGSTGYCCIASIALGPDSSTLVQRNKRYQLLTSVEARTLLRRSLALLEAVAAFPLIPSSEGNGNGDSNNTSSSSKSSSLLRSSILSLSTINVETGRAASGVRRLFEETNAGEMMSLLSQVIEHGFGTTTTSSSSSSNLLKISDESIELCISGLSTLNNIARLDLDLFQKLLLSHKVQAICNKFFNTSLISRLQGSSSSSSTTSNSSSNGSPGTISSRLSRRLTKTLFSECAIFIGFYVLNKPNHQQLLLESTDVYSRDVSSTPDDDTLLGKMLLLPRQSAGERTTILPTLLAATYKNESAQNLVGDSVMDELHSFIETNAEAMHSSDSQNFKKTKSKEDLKKVPSMSKFKIEVVGNNEINASNSSVTTAVSGNPVGDYPPFVALSHRFPVEFWMGKDGFSVHSDRCSEPV